MTRDERRGVLFGAAAYVIWGLVPIYFMAVRFASPMEVLAHRVVWSVLLLTTVLLVASQFGSVRQLSRKQILGLGLSSLLLATNWLVYVWALFNGQMIEASLGYFINPLVTVLLGVVVLAERPTQWQWLALVIAGIGVGHELLVQDRFPWVALALATSFGLYGLARKQLAVGSLAGLATEMFWLLPAALSYLVMINGSTGELPGERGVTEWSLLAVGGLVTVLPLLAFSAATRRIPLTALGLLQYLSPSIALLLALLVYDEALRPGQLLTFSCIWLALLIFSAEGLYDRLRTRWRGASA